MSNTYNARETGPISAVALPPVPDSYYADFTLEPAMVRIRSSNSAFLYTESDDIRTLDSPANNVLIGLPGNGLMTRKIKRMGITHLHFRYSTQTINASNQLLRVFRSDDNSIVPVTIPAGVYDHPHALITALVTELNIALAPIVITPHGPDGASPGFPINAYPQNCWELDSTVAIYFLWDSPAVLYGASTFGWQVAKGPVFDGQALTLAQVNAYNAICWSRMIVGPMKCVYSSYVDFRSDTLTRWTKNPNTSSSLGSNSLIFRMYLQCFDSYSANPDYDENPYHRISKHSVYSSQSPVTFTVNPDESISTIDIAIYDEYGKLWQPLPALYERPAGTPVAGQPNIWSYGIDWSIAFYTEI